MYSHLLEATCESVDYGGFWPSETPFPKSTPKTSQTTGEKEMWAAVIRQAIEDYLYDPNEVVDPYQHKKAELEKQHARYWLFNSKKTSANSFYWICNELCLDPNYIRQAAWDELGCQ
jgi:hypothetical protein